jgi:sn-glycerol 3-phosphate transport system ATP-binding protein
MAIELRLRETTGPPQSPRRTRPSIAPDWIAPAHGPTLPDGGAAGELRLAAVELRDVSKHWGKTAAVDRVSFTAQAGNLVALLGPSGCGKSTTLRLIAGLEAADAGTITIADRRVTNLPPSARGVSMVFQSYALFPHLSVAENIMFGLRVRRVRRADREARLKRAAEILGLQQLLDRKPSQLSGGQQQRVALGRAIVAETPVCLMDEPLSNLDAQLRLEMRREIRALQRRLGITMLYVTHDQVEAMTMADQVVLMRSGAIEQDAPPAELYERPATIFAARFVGTPPMNVLPAAPVGAAYPAALASAPSGRRATDLAIGVRPEDVRLAPRGLPGAVMALEYLGADTLIESRIHDDVFVIRVPGKVQADTGDIIHMTWEHGRTHWFELSTGHRVDSQA